jgi:uncharacterized protein (DUF433 family)
VWEAFHGPIPPDHVINHINGQKDDNHLENLEVMTCSENTLHAYRILGRRRPGEKLNRTLVEEIRQRRAEGESLKTLATEYRVTQACISSVCTGKTWKHANGPLTPSRKVAQTRNDVLARIDNATVGEIVTRHQNGESSGALAKEYGVSDVTVLNWAKGRYRTS